MGEEICSKKVPREEQCVSWLVTAALLKMGCYSSTTVLVLGQLLSLLSSILTILLTCPNSDTWLCNSNDPFLTVCNFVVVLLSHAYLTGLCSCAGM